MNRRPAQTRVTLGVMGLAVAMLSGFVVPHEAEAQQAPDLAPAASAEGEVTYSREVSHGVGAPYFAGTAHSIVTGPTSVIVGQLTQSLQPLTDEETAFVSASLAQPSSTMQQSLDTGLAALGGSGSTSVTAGERSGSVVSSTIGGAMDSLGSALGTMTSVLGSQQ